MQKIHDVRNAGPTHASQCCDFVLIAHGTSRDQLIEPNCQSHETRDTCNTMA